MTKQECKICKKVAACTEHGFCRNCCAEAGASLLEGAFCLVLMILNAQIELEKRQRSGG